MTEAKIFMQHTAILELMQGMSNLIRSRMQDRNIENPAMIGIHTGGAWVAEHLHSLLEIDDPLGILDISFYRDDFTRIGMHPEVKPSSVPFDVDGRHIILVDDVVQTGRTIRAALNEIFDFGRPASVMLVSLIERSGRELPIEPDVIGLEPALQADDHIRLNGPDPLSLEISHDKMAPRGGQ